VSVWQEFSRASHSLSPLGKAIGKLSQLATAYAHKQTQAHTHTQTHTQAHIYWLVYGGVG